MLTPIDSPIGKLVLEVQHEQLLAIYFKQAPEGPVQKATPGDQRVTQAVRDQLSAYFAGKRRRFDLPLAPEGTPFQQSAWETLCKIPYGRTWSYKDQAMAMNNPKAVRAVGAANGKNPIPVIIPCHRVIGSSGRLVGYAGGLGIKRTLLELEGVIRPASSGDGSSPRQLPLHLG